MDWVIYLCMAVMDIMCGKGLHTTDTVVTDIIIITDLPIPILISTISWPTYTPTHTDMDLSITTAIGGKTLQEAPKMPRCLFRLFAINLFYDFDAL